ncbi:hypothetical protein QAD02_000739 [Eretmocerus hayati]|uniref:Uncharacterized protein n=1 Tax=Eretmocerus hayati TaxID=131215 RepID=A0ACC2NIW2_9HYME|nr:hypothetical protein QAD02_000739 [Eretmocerus hayati]
MLEELYFAVAVDDLRLVTYEQVKRVYYEVESDFIILTRLIARLGDRVLEYVGEELRRIYHGIREIPSFVWFRVVKQFLEPLKIKIIVESEAENDLASFIMSRDENLVSTGPDL